MKPRVKELLRIIAVAAVGGLLFGCAVGPDFRQPQPPSGNSYVSGEQPSETTGARGPGGASQRFDPDMKVPAQWWSLFRSASLDRLVGLALEGSPTLAQARARLTQAREDFKARTGALQYPAVDADLSAIRQQVDLASFGITEVPNPAPFGLYYASVSVSYTLDLFGGNRRTLEGLMAKVDYERFELEAARQALASNVVNAAIRQASLRARIALLNSLLEAQSGQLAITEERCQAGAVSVLDVQNQSLLLNQTRASLPPLQKQLAQVDHQLAVYLGREPSEARVDDFELDDLHLPEALPLSLPSALARQRPDIRAAEALWHQACANVGVATANLFPQITLSGSFGSQGANAGAPVTWANVWSIAANIMQPVFHGGELWARKRSAVAAYEEAAATYRQTVLQGLQEVADALRALETDSRKLKARVDAAEHARAGCQIARRQYELGGISHLALLDLQRQLLQTEEERVQAQADRYADTTALLYALGGGWWQVESESNAAGRPATQETP
jgi:NodT family efflux transporter outer membrane factor (OMF) lipoprotein